jgi:hypothetical protein
MGSKINIKKLLESNLLIKKTFEELVIQTKCLFQELDNVKGGKKKLKNFRMGKNHFKGEVNEAFNILISFIHDIEIYIREVDDGEGDESW